MSTDSFYSTKSSFDVDHVNLTKSTFKPIECAMQNIDCKSTRISIRSPSSIQTMNDQESSNNLVQSDWTRPPTIRSPRPPSVYENTNETSADFLTASQIQAIINSLDVSEKRSNLILKNKQNAKVFGCNVNSLEVLHNGHLLPPFIENALVFLLRYGIDCVGVFRRSGVRSRVNAMKQRLEQVYGSDQKVNCNRTNRKCVESPTQPDMPESRSTAAEQSNRGSAILCNNFTMTEDECCVFDLADLVKGWLRELKPHALIPQSLIHTFIRLKATGQLASLPVHILNCISDTQRDLLFVFLRFFASFAGNCDANQMNAHNLAICLAPSMCEYSVSSWPNSQSTSFEQRLRSIDKALAATCDHESGAIATEIDPLQVTLMEADSLVHAQRCLEYLIGHFEQVQLLSPKDWTARSIDRPLLFETNFHIINEGHLLPPACQLQIHIPAKPTDILHRILYQRNLIDATIVRWRILEANENQNQDVLEFHTQRSHLLPAKCFRIVRSWTVGLLPKEQEKQMTNSKFYRPLEQNAWTFDYHNCYSSTNAQENQVNDVLLKEEDMLYNATYCIRSLANHTTSLLTVSIAADLRGRSFYWYKDVFPQLIHQQMQKLRRTFLLESKSSSLPITFQSSSSASSSSSGLSSSSFFSS